MKINVPDDYQEEQKRCIEDLIYVFNSRMYINEKGYLTKLIDFLWDLDYYKHNESLFIRKG